MSASHPPHDQAYQTPGNPTDKNTSEKSQTQSNAQKEEDTHAIAHRSAGKPTGDGEATATSLGRGVRGAPAGEEAHGATQAGMDSQELDAEQMGAPGEGKVADAVKGTNSGSAGKEQELGADLESKKADQAPARQKVQQEAKKEVDVGGILGQRGGPANPVD